MARSISQANTARNNTYSGDSYTNSNVSMQDLKDWYNARFYKQADGTSSGGNSDISNPISLNTDLNNKSWISIEVAGQSESYHQYQENSDAKFKVKCFSNADMDAARWKMNINGKTYGSTTTGDNTDIVSDNINIYTREELGYKVEGGAGDEHAVEIHFSWNGSTFNKITGLTARLAFGNQNSHFKVGSGSFKSMGGSGGSWPSAYTRINLNY